MTREEQKLRRELDKAIKQSCKEIGKRRGWKTVAGTQYQAREGMLFKLYISLCLFEPRQAKANFSCKPLALDNMYWDVFHMEEEAAKQPFSFHVQGAFTARGLFLPPWNTPLPDPAGLPDVLEQIFERAEKLCAQHSYPDIAAFRHRLEEEPRQEIRNLSVILCLLCEGRYQQAMEQIDAALARGENGGFSRENGCRSILADARDWCAARL